MEVVELHDARLTEPANLANGLRHRVGLLQMRHVPGIGEHAQARPRIFPTRLRARVERRQPVMSAPVLGIGDRIGRIGVGAAADLTILSPDLHVRTTIVGGIPAYSAGENEDR